MLASYHRRICVWGCTLTFYNISATVKYGDGERVGANRKLLHILIELDARAVKCEPLSIRTPQKSVTRVVNKEQSQSPVNFSIIGTCEEFIVEYFIYLFCCLVDHLGGVVEDIHVVLKELPYRYDVLFSSK